MNRMIGMAAVVALVLVGCRGPAGPVGPAGPKGATGAQGLTGPAGPPGITTIALAGQLDSLGDAEVQLPAATGTIQDPPVVTCYVGSSPTGPFLMVSTDTNGAFAGGCALVQGNGSLSAVGGLYVLFLNEPPNWYYLLAVAYSSGGTG